MPLHGAESGPRTTHRAEPGAALARSKEPCNPSLALTGSLQERLASVAGSLTSSQRSLATHLARHRRELAYASAAQVARELDVSASTVVRFAQQLGYDGWPSLQRALREELRESDRLVGLPPESAHFLDEYVEVQVRNLRFLATQADAIEEAARTLAAARTVWLAGDRASSYIAGFAAHFLRMLRPGVRLLDGGSSAAVDRLLDASEEDAVWLTSMRRYSRRSLALARHLAGRMQVVLLTDEVTSPLSPYANTRVYFAPDSVTALRSDVGAYATAHALVLAVARHVPGSRGRLARAEALWDEFELFHREDRS